MSDKICTVTTLKVPLNQTIDFVNYHLNIGVDHMFLFFDDPKDKAIEYLKDYKKVTCFRCNDKYWREMILKENIVKDVLGREELQKLKEQPKNKNLDIVFQRRLELNASFTFDLIKDKDYDWIFAHLDGDELIYTKGNLKKILSVVSKKTDVLCLLAKESVPEKYSYKNPFTEIKLFKSFGKISNFYYSNKKLLQKIVPLVRKNEGNLAGIYFSGHSAGKSIARKNSPIKKFSGHRPQAKRDHKLIFEFSSRAHLLHFDCFDFKDWKAKWLNRYNSKFEMKKWENSKRRDKVYNSFVKTYEGGDEKDLKDLYRKQFMISKTLKPLLLLTGLLKNIKLAPKLFNRPTIA